MDDDLTSRLRRRGRAVHRRPSSANNPLSRATRIFLDSLPQSAIRRRVPLRKFGRSRLHWDRKIKCASRHMISRKQQLQIGVLVKRARRSHRRGRRVSQRRSIRRRIKLAVGVRLSRCKGVVNAREGTDVPQRGRVLVLPSHRWLARRFAMRTEVRHTGPCGVGSSTARSSPVGAQKRPRAEDYVDERKSVPQCPTVAEQSDGSRQMATTCRLAVSVQRSMKQFRLLLSATTWKHNKSIRFDGITTTKTSSSLVKSNAPPPLGLLVDCSDMLVFSISGCSVGRESHTDEGALGKGHGSASFGELLPAVLSKLLGNRGVFPAGTTAELPGTVVRGALRTEAGWLAMFLCNAAPIRGDDGCSSFFLVVPSSDVSGSAAKTPSAALVALFQVVARCAVAPIYVTLENGVSASLSFTQSTLWSPCRGGSVARRTGLLSVLVPNVHLESRYKSICGFVAQHDANATYPSGVSVTVSGAFLLEPSALPSSGGAARLGFGRVLLFVSSEAARAPPRETDRTMPVVGPHAPPNSVFGKLGAASQKQGPSLQHKRANAVQRRVCDLEESAREVAFRSTRDLHRALLVAALENNAGQPGKFIAAGLEEETHIYLQHVVPIGFHGRGMAQAALSNSGFACSVTPTSVSTRQNHLQLTSHSSAPIHAQLATVQAGWSHFVALRAAHLSAVITGAANEVRRPSLVIAAGHVIFRVSVSASKRMVGKKAKRRGCSCCSLSPAPSVGGDQMQQQIYVDTMSLVGVVAREAVPCALLGGERIGVGYLWAIPPPPPPAVVGFNTLELLMACSPSHARHVGLLSKGCAAGSEAARAVGARERCHRCGSIKKGHSLPALNELCDATTWIHLDIAQGETTC